MRTISQYAVLCLMLVLTSCASTTPKEEYSTYNEKYSGTAAKSLKGVITDHKKIPQFRSLSNKMSPGFLFSLSHPSDEKLKGRFRADFSGILRLPYGVRINVKGMTFNKLKKRVLKSYSKFFQKGVRNVSFKLIYRQYYVEVRGFIKKSGRYLVTKKEGIDKVIDKAGGLKGELSKGFYKATIKQQSRSYSISLNQYFQNNFYSKSITWTGGDSIFVSEQDESEMGGEIPIVSVLGGVLKPGKILYKKKAHLFYYLGKSGGTVPALSYDESYIIRNTSKGIKKIKFDITDMDAVPAIKPNDTILLQASKRTRTDRIFERTTQISSFLLTALLVLAL